MTKVALIAFCFITLAVPVFASALVNINTADKATLTTLSGIGDVKAQAIIDYRNAHGPFTAIEDIMNVSGIGTATFNNIKTSITVDGGSPGSSGSQTVPDQQAQPDTQAPSTTTTANATTSLSNAPVSSYVAPPEPTLFADAGGNRTVIVGADTVFNARAYNKNKEDVDHVRFLWNFGDGSTAEGPSVLHHYDYPGRYATVLTIAENRDALATQFIVTAEPARLSFAANGDGSVTIGNLAGRDLDLSQWIIRSFGRTFILPEHSVILAGSSMRLSQKTLNFFSGAQTELDYPNGALALNANGSTRETTAPPSASVPVPETAIKKETTANAENGPADFVPVTNQNDTTTVDAIVTDTAIAEFAAAGQTQSSGGYWWLGALGFAGALGAGAITVRRLKKKEWDIVEETQEAG